MDKDSQTYGKSLQHKERRLSGKERRGRKERMLEKEDEGKEREEARDTRRKQ